MLNSFYTDMEGFKLNIKDIQAKDSTRPEVQSSNNKKTAELPSAFNSEDWTHTISQMRGL